MTKEKKTIAIEELKELFAQYPFFYVTDSTLKVEKVNKLRRMCFEKGVTMKVVKNTLVQKALESQPAEKNYAAIFPALEGPTAILFTDVANLPAKMIEEFRKTNDKPLLKAAYIDSAVFIGDDQLKTLSSLKSKEELLGEVIGLLQSPMQRLLGALKSGGNTVAGLLKTLEEREQA